MVYVALSGLSYKAPNSPEATRYTDFSLNATHHTEEQIIDVTISSVPPGFEVTLSAHLIAGSWDVKKVSNNDETPIIFHPNHRVLASDGSSFACGDLHLIGIKPDLTRTTITLENLQMQPIFTASEAPFEFGQPWNCTGFFSAGIWGGLFIVILFLTIMSYGISFILDIKTMSQFEDPKGKTITINAGE